MNSKPLITITSNASMKGWGTYCQDQRTGRPRSKLQTKEHINILELKAAKFFILTFTKIFSQAKITHLRMDNIAALSYIAKMGAAPTTKFCQIQPKKFEITYTFSLQEYLIKHQHTQLGNRTHSTKERTFFNYLGGISRNTSFHPFVSQNGF